MDLLTKKKSGSHLERIFIPIHDYYCYSEKQNEDSNEEGG